MMHIDFHSHILPRVDDGSHSSDESVEMLKMEAQQGIGHVVATPHFYANSDTPDRFLLRRQGAEQRLREKIAGLDTMPQLTMGAEVYYFRGISESDRLCDLTIGKKGFILLEMPAVPWTESMFREIEQIYLKQKLVPVIAHIDRYIAPFRTHGIPERLQDLPVLVQANASFFLHWSTQGMALKMLRRQQIHLIGSDCHNLTDRAPNLGDAYRLIRQKLGQETVDFVDRCGAQVLFGEGAAF